MDIEALMQQCLVLQFNYRNSSHSAKFFRREKSVLTSLFRDKFRVLNQIAHGEDRSLHNQWMTEPSWLSIIYRDELSHTEPSLMEYKFSNILVLSPKIALPSILLHIY